ncbi:DUF7344 domain-containing protein [Haloterrigena alkaliphila]|uniref:DUF7344 domain-containing protein n=1 Tax=Haloterrigena alkaliphila TaxID=2816475 RepID=A0A8A2V885_9EURY|nr:hypothetical protein [Haloterrigena alkaliphila]QSW98169.1 hypothetical protein J0X25_12190 [Haloterrigena alkaliphila]
MPDSDGTIKWGDLLSSRRRALIAMVLLENCGGDPIDVGELATEVARLESQTQGPVDKKSRQSVYTTSTQYHLPKLDSANVVNYDSTTVAPGENLRRYYAFAVLLPGSGIESRPLSP